MVSVNVRNVDGPPLPQHGKDFVGEGDFRVSGEECSPLQKTRPMRTHR